MTNQTTNSNAEQEETAPHAVALGAVLAVCLLLFD
jgi:hypothetical protein